jgi:hypothetical protein
MSYNLQENEGIANVNPMLYWRHQKKWGCCVCPCHVLLEFAKKNMNIVFPKTLYLFCYNLQRIEVIYCIVLTIWSFSIIVANNESTTFILSLLHLILEFIETMRIFHFANYLNLKWMIIFLMYPRCKHITMCLLTPKQVIAWT